MDRPIPAFDDRAHDADFTALYRRWFGDVSRWVRALGIPDSEREDVTQEVFLVVRRKLSSFDGGNLPAWLYRIAVNITGDHRRRGWFRNLIARRATADLEARPAAGGPEDDLQHKQLQRALYRLLDRMSDKHRVTLVLFEIEGYSGEEIAALHGVPVDTVWTRLHHARKRFQQLLADSPDLPAGVAARRNR